MYINIIIIIYLIITITLSFLILYSYFFIIYLDYIIQRNSIRLKKGSNYMCTV